MISNIIYVLHCHIYTSQYNTFQRPTLDYPEGCSNEPDSEYKCTRTLEMMNEIIEDNPDKFIFIRNPEDISTLENNKKRLAGRFSNF